MMELFVVDRLEVFSDLIGVEIKTGDECVEIVGAFSNYNIESAVLAPPIGHVSLFVHKRNGLSHSAFKEEIDEIVAALPAKKKEIQEGVSLISIKGLFLTGAQSPMKELLDLFKKRHINIEYQVMYPAEYAMVIKTEYVRKALVVLARKLKIRDANIYFHE